MLYEVSLLGVMSFCELKSFLRVCTFLLTHPCTCVCVCVCRDARTQRLSVHPGSDPGPAHRLLMLHFTAHPMYRLTQVTLAWHASPSLLHYSYCAITRIQKGSHKGWHVRDYPCTVITVRKCYAHSLSKHHSNNISQTGIMCLLYCMDWSTTFFENILIHKNNINKQDLYCTKQRLLK